VRVIFVASNDTQAKQFLSVAEQLPAEVRFLSLDAYYAYDATPVLEGAGIQPFELTWRGREFDLATPILRYWMFWKGKADVDRILDTFRPDVTVLGNDMGPIERLIIQQSKVRGVPALLVQDGVISPKYWWESSSTWRRVCRNGRDLILRLMGLPGLAPVGYGASCDFVAAYDLPSREIFLGRGCNPDRVRVTGQPRYDTWGNPVNVAEWRKKIGIPQDGEVISFFTTNYATFLQGNEHESLVSVVLRTMYRGGQGRFGIIKVHPRENADYYEQLIRRLGLANMHVVRNVDARIIIELSSLVIVHVSTVGHEALLLGKPVFVADLLPHRGTLVLDRTAAIEDGAALRYTDSDALEKGITCFFDDGKTRHDLQAACQVYRLRFPELIDGKAAQRVGQFILEIAEQGD